MFDWPYFTLLNGRLYYDVGDRRGTQLTPAFKDAPLFKDSVEAEQWLMDNDHRGNVR